MRRAFRRRTTSIEPGIKRKIYLVTGIPFLEAVAGRRRPATTTMHVLPPLECLRFFDAAARHESFVRAADELQVTAAAVAHRIRVLEAHLRAPLFHRRHRGVRLTDRGRQYHADIQRILRDIGASTARVRRWYRSRS